MFWKPDRWLALFFGEEGIHLWHGAQRLDHCVTDEVGEGDLATATALEVIVNHDAVINH